MKKALDYAVKLGYIKNNPIVNVEMPKVQKYISEYYSLDLLEKLLEVTKDTEIEAAVFLIVHYGFRRGEALGLRYSDINFTDKTLTIQNTRTGVKTNVEKAPKTASSIRTLPLIPIVEQYLRQLQQKQLHNKELFGDCYIDNDYICKYSDGRAVNMTSLNHIFKRILKQNNMPPVRIHGLRHSVASYLLKIGLSLKEIQVWLGHSDISVTANFYTHVDIGMKINTAQKINELFSTDNKF